MAFERTWPAVVPILFTANGSAFGLITVSSTYGFKVKQNIVLQSSSQPFTLVQVNRVLSSTQMYVGRVGKPISDRFNASGFTVADGAFAMAEEQGKAEVPKVDQYHAVYEQEPTVAWRSVLVDELGQFYRTDNPLPVQLTDGSINIETLNANLQVQLSHKDDDPNPGDVADSVRIGDGVDELQINPDGSINVNVVPLASVGGLNYEYNEILAIPSGVETAVITITVPSGQKRLQKIDVSGTNVAEFRIKLNTVVFGKIRIWHTDFNNSFKFEQFASGLKLLPGDTLVVTAIHNRPFPGDFNATAWFI